MTTATIRYSGVVDAITTPVIHCIRCQSQRLPIQETVGRGTRLARALDIYTPWLWILAIRISCTQVVMKVVQRYTERLIVEVTTGFSGGRTNTILIDNTSTDATMIYAGTYSNGVYRSTNNGSSWESMNDGLDVMNINCLDVNPNNYIFAGTNGSSTYRWSLLVGAEESKEESIGRFVFFAKPNPAKGQTVLNFQLTRQTAVELSIYDIQGRLVKNLINDIKQAGTHKISWDGFDGKDNRVSAGIYFCKLKTENTDYLEKLILVK